MGLLKLTALDADDLSVISAHMQDAVAKVGDIRFLREKQKFSVLANRFAWDAVGGAKQSYERRRSGLQFARVRAARSSGIPQNAETGVLSLLSIGFEPADPPSGTITLNFAGGGTIKLEVECIEAQLDDLGPAWATPHLPAHEDEQARS